jgi:hypothetical protein
MRKLLGVLGISTTLVLGAGGVAAADTWFWVGPYPTYAECEASELGFQASGHLTAGCSYRDLAHPWQDGYYFPAWPVE